MTTDPKLIDVAKAAGVSYRQADYWQKHHYVETYLGPHPGRYSRKRLPRDAGSGFIRYVTPHEAHVFHLMAALVDMGMNAAAAAPIARRLAEVPGQPVVCGRIAVSVVDG